jgi:hypothetical protein
VADQVDRLVAECAVNGGDIQHRNRLEEVARLSTRLERWKGSSIGNSYR